MDIKVSNRKVEVHELDNSTVISIEGVGRYAVPKECVYILPLNNDNRYYIAVVAQKSFIEEAEELIHHYLEMKSGIKIFKENPFLKGN